MNIKKLFIANRAEIASRIIRTAHSLSIECTVVSSQEDLSLPYLTAADYVHRLPSHEAKSTFLDPDLMIDIARKYDCDAIHPGFGFLSENADFADKIVSAGLIFVGPNSDAMRTLGSKIAAKELARSVKVPVLPELILQDAASKESIELAKEFFKAQKGQILIKASGGGGGRGMRVVQNSDDLSSLLQAASKEAEKFFGDASVFIERRVDNARHIEVQIFGDMHGNVTHLFERDCSVQRRHQKIIEEAPAPRLKQKLREQAYDYALSLGKALGYDNAGTVEFLLSPAEELFFLEVNSRLQVEHPVTEELLGVDLVQWQLQAADGQDLADSFAALPQHLPERHVIEVRICAESPARNFAPDTGVVESITLSKRVRNDFGYSKSSWIGTEFDSMIGKVIASGSSRENAIELLDLALQETLIAGVETNLSFALNLLRNREFQSAQMHTALITTDYIEQFKDSYCSQELLWVSSYAVELIQHCPAAKLSSQSTINSSREIEYSFADRSGTALITTGRNQEISLKCSDDTTHIIRPLCPYKANKTHFYLNEKLIEGQSFVTRSGVHTFLTNNGLLTGKIKTRKLKDNSDSVSTLKKGAVCAELPGKIMQILCANNSSVRRGDVVMVMESMKMELPIVAPCEGMINNLQVQSGTVVSSGALLFEVKAS